MVRLSLAVIDNFYDNPDDVRECALSLDFRKKPDQVFPGAEGFSSEVDWSNVTTYMQSIIREKCGTFTSQKPNFSQGKFNLALARDEDKRLSRVHVDLNKWSGVIYLSKPQDCQGGTSWYRHRQTGALEDSEDWCNEILRNSSQNSVSALREHILKVSKDMTEWEEIQRVAMKYNRAVVFNAKVFHGTSCLFGDKMDNGRLTQHFEFYSE